MPYLISDSTYCRMIKLCTAENSNADARCIKDILESRALTDYIPQGHRIKLQNELKVNRTVNRET